jgi:hypothetical protein
MINIIYKYIYDDLYYKAINAFFSNFKSEEGKKNKQIIIKEINTILYEINKAKKEGKKELWHLPVKAHTKLFLKSRFNINSYICLDDGNYDGKILNFYWKD